MAVVEAADQLGLELERQISELEGNESAMRGGDAEALHRFRVATRRSRALLRPCTGVDEMQRELRWLAGTLGPVRDLDVLIEHVQELVEELDDDRAGGEAIVAALEAQRSQARTELMTALDSERYKQLLDRFRHDITLLAETDHGHLVSLARRELKRLQQAYAALGPTPPDDELHRVRIKAKRTRYAAELAGKPLARLADAAKRLQDAIGVHQDAVVAEQRVRQVAKGQSLLAAGRMIERQRERRRDVRAELPKVWKQLERVAAKALKT
jgi:CHAD domain-containing protein